jgi:stress response protein YsnF
MLLWKKTSVVYERVVVRRAHTDAVNRVDASVRREELRLDRERS